MVIVETAGLQQIHRNRAAALDTMGDPSDLLSCLLGKIAKSYVKAPVDTAGDRQMEVIVRGGARALWL